ncbi:MAG: hypothetical protein WCQ72_01025 [Eubacteriales bacterium]
MNKNIKRITALLLCAMLTAGMLASCGSDSGNTPAATTAAAAGDTTAAETTEPDALAGVDLGGETMRIYVNTFNLSAMGNSNYLVEGPEEETGDLVNDSAYARNRTVEEKLNVKLEFIQSEKNYDKVSSDIAKYINSGDDAFDLIIDDLYPLAELTLQGMFQNAMGGKYFDFDQKYWMRDFMEDMTIGNDSAYILAGDFFIDVLRTAHGLIFNKDLMTNLGLDSSELYSTILDGKWTYDEFMNYINAGYADLNGDSQRDVDDQYGFVTLQIWGPSIPMIMSGDPGFITRDEDGIPSIAVNNEKSIKLLDKLLTLFYSDGVYYENQDAETAFMNGKALFIGYQRLGSLEYFRSMEDEIGIVPYPKLDEQQENYVTSVHDTTQVGVIPVTTSKLEMISAVTEALCRETQETVIPAYYETALKVKYTRDDESAQMIDIIHDNISQGFALAYDSSLGTILMKGTFYTSLESNQNKFVSLYSKMETASQKKLDKMVETFQEAVAQ